MPRYWVIAPFESKSPEIFDKIWQFDLESNLISIGWEELGDISSQSREKLFQVIATTYPDKPQQTKGLIANMLWSFYHEISVGDLIIARRGRKSLAAIGKVSQSAFYAPNKNPYSGHPNFIEVDWQEQPRNKLFSNIVFPMHTLMEITEETFQNFLQNTNGQTLPLENEGVEDFSSFVLEKYLEEFIVSNFNTIFQGKLQVYEDADGYVGQQYSTDIGSIDILAVEKNSKSFVVIELKKGRPSDSVVGQILRYMGWVRQNLCTQGQAVKGLIICRDPDPKMSYALEMTGNIEVRYYSMSFKLKETP